MPKYIKDLDTWKKELSVYDVDDTLIYSTSKIMVTDTRTGKVKEYTTEKFINFKEKDYFEVSFDGFEDVEHFLKGELIKKYVNKLKSDFKNGKALAIVTGRKSKKNVQLLLKRIGVRIPNDMIYTVTADVERIIFKEEMAMRKKAAFLDLIRKGYTSFKYYEDGIDNINAVKSLEKEKDVKIVTFLAKR